MAILKDPILGVEIELQYEDPRYPILTLQSDTFGTTGYELDLSDGSLRRICICDAKFYSECVCGAWDEYSKGSNKNES